MSFGNSPADETQIRRKQERFRDKADAARAARLAGHKSLLRRLLNRLSPRRDPDTARTRATPHVCRLTSALVTCWIPLAGRSKGGLGSDGTTRSTCGTS
jgi:hypothetical protein